MEIKNRLPLQKTIESFRTITSMDGDYAADIKLIIENAAKNGVEIASITHEDGGITVTCEGGNDVSFRQFWSDLEKSKRFAAVNPPPEGYPHPTGGTVKLQHKTGK